MMIRIYILLCCYYLVGIIAIAIINRRKKDGEGGVRWTKLIAYIIITGSLTTLLFFTHTLALAVAMIITGIGLAEVALLRTLRRVQRLFIISGYFALAICFCMFVWRAPYDQFVCFTYIIVLSFDGFSQISGQLIGGRVIAPKISPGKTYAGLAGGILMGVVTAALIGASWLPSLPVIAVIICLFAFAGDMIASAIKRLAGVKDYSSLIPGHGGMLDRFDSFIFTGAMLECYFRLS